MAANPKDLYLHLFQLALTTFLCISAGMCLLLGGASYKFPALILFVVAIMLGSAALIEASTLSEQNIEKTKAKLQKSIDDAKSKLDLPPGIIGPRE